MYETIHKSQVTKSQWQNHYISTVKAVLGCALDASFVVPTEQ